MIRYTCKGMGLNCLFAVDGETVEEVTKQALAHVIELTKTILILSNHLKKFCGWKKRWHVLREWHPDESGKIFKKFHPHLFGYEF